MPRDLINMAVVQRVATMLQEYVDADNSNRRRLQRANWEALRDEELVAVMGGVGLEQKDEPEPAEE